jgi:peptidoglycan/LPS O-acetylase OafA/YrhL
MFKAAATTSRRLEILDLARGVGFLIVLFRHSLALLSTAVLARVMPQDATILDFFFLLSGFFAAYAYEKKLRTGQKTVNQAIIERMARIYPMVVLGTVLGAASLFAQMLLSSDPINFTLTIVSLVKGSLLIPSHAAALDHPWPMTLFPLDGPLWFLFFDGIAYLLFLFVLRFLSLSGLFAIAGLSALSFLMAAISHNNVGFGAAWQDFQYTPSRVLFGFTTGYILFKLHRPQRFHISNSLSALPIIALLLVIFIPVPANWAHSGELQAFISIIVMPAIIVLGLHTQAGPRAKVLSRLAARISLAVFALHYPIVSALSCLRWKFHLHGALGLALLAVEFLLPLGIALAATIYIDDPVRAFLLARWRFQSFQQSKLQTRTNG